MRATQIRDVQGLHTCSISILVTIWYYMLTCCQQPDQNSDPNISQISEAWMMNVMPRPPTGTGSNLCDECDGVWSQDDNLEYPSSGMSYWRVFSVKNGIIEGWGWLSVWPPTSGEVSSLVITRGRELWAGPMTDLWMMMMWLWCCLLWRTL